MPRSSPPPTPRSPHSESPYAKSSKRASRTRPRHDNEFYLTNIIFQVEDILFKVPQRDFETNSDFFRQMLTLQPPKQLEPDGLSDDQPIHLEGIEKDEFRAFLHILYQRYPHLDVGLGKEQWISVLKLATMWEFSRVRDLAIANLPPLLDPTEQVVISKEYHIKEWLVPALNELAKRKEPISFEEGSRIGFDIALKLAAIRESVGLPMTVFYDGFLGQKILALFA